MSNHASAQAAAKAAHPIRVDAAGRWLEVAESFHPAATLGMRNTYKIWYKLDSAVCK